MEQNVLIVKRRMLVTNELTRPSREATAVTSAEAAVWPAVAAREKILHTAQKKVISSPLNWDSSSTSSSHCNIYLHIQFKKQSNVDCFTACCKVSLVGFGSGPAVFSVLSFLLSVQDETKMSFCTFTRFSALRFCFHTCILVRLSK